MITKDLNRQEDNSTELYIANIVNDLNSDYSNFEGKPHALKLVKQAQNELNRFGYELRMVGKQFGYKNASTEIIDTGTTKTVTFPTKPPTIFSDANSNLGKTDNSTPTVVERFDDRPVTNTTTVTSTVPLVDEETVIKTDVVTENVVAETETPIYSGGGGGVGGAFPSSEPAPVTPTVAPVTGIKKYLTPRNMYIGGIALTLITLGILRYKKII